MHDFFRVSEFLFGDNPWEPQQFGGDKQNDLAQQAAYAHSLASTGAVDPGLASTLVLLREAGMLYQPNQLGVIKSQICEELSQALKFFYEVEGKIDAHGEPRKNLSNSFTLSELQLSLLRENALCKVVLEAELGAFLIRNLWYELFYDYGEFTTGQLDGLVKRSVVSSRDKERISSLEKDPTVRVIFIGGESPIPECQFASCRERAEATMFCSECPACEQLCGKHAKQSKNDVWGYWIRFSKTCGHNVEMRDCAQTRLISVILQ